MAEFITDKQLDDKLTDIIWNAKKELIILSPFIRLDDYCKNVVFKNLKNNPELEIIIVFGKNEGETQRSLTPADLEIFKEFSNISIIYCKNLHAKYYANENEALLTSLNLLGKSMTENVEYGIYFQNSKLNLEKLYTDSISYTNQVITDNPCVYIKRSVFKKTNFGLTKKYIESKVLYDVTDSLYKNRDFDKKYYNDFEYDILETDIKPTREEYVPEIKNITQPQHYIASRYKETEFVREETENKKYSNSRYNRNQNEEYGYCIRTGIKIPFDPQKLFSYEAYQTWAIFENWNYRENYCHKTGRESNGRTSMAKPVL
ncbi:phospholipase D family protein [Flavobacterium sp. ZE23DGlu08]|uniref:phospholipase D family protein n=1 Tax=Flavobacterium sp. ZE23DGlu08 TaxID=3059026 RepID=UPI00265F437E|nr:phospholipase D family protein [Flavobacterium sp. ZE23DGlu08]WKL44891.1 phospholipase D family protein [Flavobacterium sp. ZE23DGlu08]